MVSYNDYVALSVTGTDSDEVRRSRSFKRWWFQLSRFQRSVIYILVIILCCLGLYLLPDSKNTLTVEAEQKPVMNSVNKDMLINVNKKERETNENNNNVLEEPGNEIGGNSDHLNQIGIPPSFEKHDNETFGRKQAVVNAFKHAWKGYKRFAWGHDHLRPISEGYHDWFGLGLTIVDSLDTIYLMGLKEEYLEAREWVDKHLHFNVNRDVNLFEVTIRVLGGLLSIYHLSGDKMYLEKATDLGDRLLPCFGSESGVPYSDVNLLTKKAHAPKWSPDSSTSEVTTIQLEFRDLSRCTGNTKYEEAVAKVSAHIHTLEKKDGLVPIYINANTGQFRSYSTITLGARGDSYYEYLVKQWIQTGRTIDYLKDDYIAAIDGVNKHLARRTLPNGFLFIGELLVGGKDFKPKMDHLTCYLPGTLALGVHHGLTENHLKLAIELMKTCYQTYAQQPTFLAPEITYFNIQGENSNDMYVKSSDAHNLLRPEFIESLWYMYRFTNNSTYRDMGWKIFQGFEVYTKVANGYTSIENVRNAANVRPRDMMESFFLSETLKYLYLLFSDDASLFDLDKVVVNSEAHALPIYDS